MGRMIDALKRIEGQATEQSAAQTVAVVGIEPEAVPDGAPEAELSFPDEMLSDTTALLDELEKTESAVRTLIEEQTAVGQTATEERPVVEEPVVEEPVVEEPVVEEQAAAIVSDSVPRAKVWSRDSRHVDLATNILAQLPATGPASESVSLLFAATDAGGVYAASLVPLFSTLAEQVEGRTLVVECDYRHAALARRFSVEPKYGLADVLSSLARWSSAVCQSQQSGLDVLCARADRSVLDKSALDQQRSIIGAKGSPSWSIIETILAEMHEQYRLVLLENVSATDQEMSQLASLCHGAYLLLRAGQTPRIAARQSVKSINHGGGQLLGCVLLDP